MIAMLGYSSINLCSFQLSGATNQGDRVAMQFGLSRNLMCIRFGRGEPNSAVVECERNKVESAHHTLNERSRLRA